MENYILPFLWMRGESEEIIREEIEKIHECQIGAICIEARPHDDFCGPGWWHDMDIVIDEAKKRNMKIWILDDKHFPTGYAAGLIEKKYPERKKQYIACTMADIFGTQKPQTLNVSRMLKPVIGFWQIGEPADYEERAKNEVLSVVALRFTEQQYFEEEVIDLTDSYENGMVTFTLPEGQWRIHVIYKTRTDGGNETYINMLDRTSAHTQIEGVYESHYEHYKEEFGKTIAGFFSDEPQFGNTKEQCFDTKLGKKGMQLPWSNQMEEMLTERYGNEYRKYIPFLFAESDKMQICPQMRYDYMDCASKLYEQNFSRPIGEWCRAHGVEYIGHVVEDNGVHSRLGLGAAHYFRAMSGQDMAGIDVIGGQIIYGAPALIRKGMGGMDVDGEFFHYTLGKLGASAGHLDPKKKGRTMCELFGAYGWNFGVRNMKYLLDHLLCRGVNYLVPHAFSMADYPDIDCPPHFYARGNNPQFPWFAELMKYANRVCGIFQGGTHRASVAVLYDGEADWAGEHMKMQEVARVLMEHQIEFDFVCVDMLKDLTAYHGAVKNNKLIINGVEFEALLVPYSRYVTDEFTGFIRQHMDLPVYFVGGFPEQVLQSKNRCTGRDESWKDSCAEIELEEVAKLLYKKGIYQVKLEPAFSQISVYHYCKQRQIFMFFNESADHAFRGKVEFAVQSELIYYDAFRDTFEKLETESRGGRTFVKLELEPGESCIIMERIRETENPLEVHESCSRQIGRCTARMDISKEWKTGIVRAKQYPGFETMLMGSVLKPISDTKPAFSGIIRYEKTVVLDEVPKKVYLKAEQVYEVMRVSVNGEHAGYRLTPPYQLEIGRCLKPGKNEIVIEVATTPARDQLNYPMPPFDFSHEPLEPTGMFGDISLFLNEEE